MADEYRARIEQLRQAIESEIRRRLVMDRGAEALARSVRKPLPEDIDVMHATREELTALRLALHPLSRKLAVRLARKRRHRRRGPLDFRATVRRSLSTGGVPIEPRFRHPRPAKPEIFVVADISGSVASLRPLHPAAGARHQLAVLQGAQLRVRRRHRRGDPVLRGGRGPVRGGAPDQHRGRRDLGGRPLGLRARPVGVQRALGRRGHRRGPSVLVLGDARNNYHASRVLGARAARRTRPATSTGSIPSRADYWGSGDSIVDEYAVHCDAVVECRTLRQLERFVGELA